MSVYTTVDHAQLVSLLARYAAGDLVDFHGIADGIENTNYFVTTTQGRFVLTVFEEISATQLPYFLDLMAYLAERGIPSPHPIADRTKQYLQQINGKPAALVQRLDGHSVMVPDDAQAAAIGTAMGSMHKATNEYSIHWPGERGAAWHEKTAKAVMPHLTAADQHLLKAEIAFQRTAGLNLVPQRVIHADLFRDNALFSGTTLTGIIDFYYAHSGAFIYDLAVTVADWCHVPTDAFDLVKAAALLQAYCRERQPTNQEIALWIPALRAAGLRFWLSRLKDLHFPKAGEITHIKDPEPFKRVILDSQTYGTALQNLWK